MDVKRAKEYITTTLCMFGFHAFGERFNGSKFIDNGGWSFGWVARWERRCKWCGNSKYSHVFLKSDRERMIKEAHSKRRCY